MISKKVLSEIVSKYSLGGHVEKVKWVVNEDNSITIKFINDSKTLVGKINYQNTIGLKKGSYGIFNTSQLVKCLNILDGDILIETKTSNGLASKLELADTNYDVKFSLADPAIIPKVPKITNEDQPSASFEMTDEFITRFVKSKDALNDLPSFTIETREGGFSGNELVFTIGTDITNTIQFKIDELFQINDSFEQIPFDSNLFKEILKANRNYESGTIHINKKGLIELKFHYSDGFNTNYYLIRLQENN
jgi:hypothetical protein